MTAYITQSNWYVEPYGNQFILVQNVVNHGVYSKAIYGGRTPDGEYRSVFATHESAANHAIRLNKPVNE